MADLPRFDLGQAGLVLTSSPLHGAQGQLTKAQNIEFKRVLGLGGMGSRAPLTAFSKSLLATMTGNVLTACAIPLPSPLDNLTLPLVLLATSTGYLVSTGSGWTLITLTLPPTGVGIVQAAGIVAYTGAYDGTTTKVVVNNTEVDVPGYVSGIVGHPNGRFYVSVVRSAIAYSGIQNAGGWNGGQFNNTTQTPTNRVTGVVLEISAAGVILRQLGETFGLDNTSQTSLSASSPPYTTFPLGSPEDGRSGGGPNNFGRGPLGAAPAGLAVGTSGRVYVTFGSYYLLGSTGVHSPTLDLYQGIDYLSIDPSSETTWKLRTNHGALGVSETEFDTGGGVVTAGPGEILADALNADDPWFVGFSPDFSTVSSSLARTDGNLQGSPVFSNGVTGNLKIFPDPNGATIAGFAYWVGLIKFNNAMFVAYYDASNPGSDPAHVRVYTTSTNDASTLTLDHDVLTSVTPAPPSVHVYPGKPYVFNDGGGNALYWPFYGLPGHTASGFVLKRTAGGTWTVHDSGLSNLTGASLAYSVAV